MSRNSHLAKFECPGPRRRLASELALWAVGMPEATVTKTAEPGRLYVWWLIEVATWRLMRPATGKSLCFRLDPY